MDQAFKQENNTIKHISTMWSIMFYLRQVDGRHEVREREEKYADKIWHPHLKYPKIIQFQILNGWLYMYFYISNIF